jgi:multidrug resistance efflux pump
MKTLLLISVYFFFSISCYTAILSSVSSGIINYVPAKGEVVKKGKTILKLTNPILVYEIAESKLDLELAKHNLADKKSDLSRINKLHKSKVISTAKHEDMVVSYYRAHVKFEKLKIHLKKLETEQRFLTISAPYDCVITEVFLMPNSGVSKGRNILSAKEIINPEKIKKLTRPFMITEQKNIQA